MTDEARHPNDPRLRFARHRERGPRRFWYGWTVIARLLGCSEKRAQNLASAGAFDPKDIESLVALRELRRRAPRAPRKDRRRP